MPLEMNLHRFVRGLLAGTSAVRDGEHYALRDGRKAQAERVLALIASGAIGGDAQVAHANAETAAWLKRALLDGDAFGAQHRTTSTMADSSLVNLAESPLSRLAHGASAFLEQHQVEAGERVRKLVERAQLQPRLTMAYSVSRTAGHRPELGGGITDMAADARQSVAEIHSVLPLDCAGVVLDVCGMLKGLQTVERERGWPRRSAKLVLRIGLEQLAQHYGLGPFAIGRTSHRPHRWMAEGARPERFE